MVKLDPKLRETMRNLVVIFVVVIGSLLPPSTTAQVRPPLGPPNFVEARFVTVGGITYFQHVSQLRQWCNRIGAYPVTRNGTNFVQAIQEEGLPPEYICICDPIECGPAPRVEATSVLGALAPGHYRLTLLSTNLTGGGPQPPILATATPFVVEPTFDRTLTISKLPAGDSFLVSVSGVSGVNYITECSADLTTWTAIRTNQSAPFTLTLSASETQQFHRVSIAPVPSAE